MSLRDDQPETNAPREGLHPDVLREVNECWSNGRPWTKIRELRKGLDDSEGAKCGGSVGNHHIECKNKVEGIQYTTAYGDPAFFCEEHALAQNEWEKNVYEGKPKPVKNFPDEYFADVRRLFEKMNRRKRKKEEQTEEIDPS